jgi:four helix bundle protein
MIQSYRDLEVYQRAMRLLVPLHKQLLQLPDYEKYELGSQIRRCCKSIPANIAEGYSKRRSAKEFKRYLTIALGEANEMVVHLDICRELRYIDAESCAEYIDGYTIIGKQLNRLISNWRTYPEAPSS